MDSNSGRHIVSPTIAYHTSIFIFVVRGKSILSSLGRLAKPFTINLWVLVAGFLLFTMLFTSVLKVMKLKVYQFVFGKENHSPVTNFFALFLGYGVSQTPRRNFARYIFVLLLFLTLVLRSAYQGSLYDAFRKDSFDSKLSGYDDLIKSNYVLLSPPEAPYLPNYPNKLISIVLTHGYEKRLTKLETLENRYTTLVVLDAFLYYVQKKLRNGTELLLIPERVNSFQLVMFLPKHSIYLSVFNRKLKELAAAGITSKFSSESTSIDQIIKAYLMRQREKLPLHNARLSALYGIWFISLGVSLVVFILEILSVRNRKLQKLFL
ncbi:uncharacterized protein LOC129911316 [Episyrphus balteatus]|uniref:uncharacterized protein LOC129911316 n=1 Tax=Episyrphus balteatus TaxID=286459 RepID=UPI0024855839|nr:uncharacterized protein LOC129911316 [Episyrphus balteatus]